MSNTPVPPQFQPVHIGEEAKPALAVLPDVAHLFMSRAARFRALAPEHQLADYLLFLASLAEAQDAILAGLPDVVPPDGDALEQALIHGMAPLNRTAFKPDAVVHATLDALLEKAKSITMPDNAAAALDGLLAATRDEREALMRAVLSDAIKPEEIAEHVFAGAALQVHFARLAATLPADRLTPVSDGACPACGAPPVSSSVVGWREAYNTRFCTCSLCATHWHVVRIKCVTCSSTKGIRYSHLEGTADTIKAECCDECGSYVKLLQQIKDTDLDPVADDVASLGLDMKVKEDGYRRAGHNLFLAGF